MAADNLTIKIGTDLSGLDAGIREATQTVSSFGDVLKGSFLGGLAANLASSAFSAFTGSVSEAFSALQEVDKLAGQTAAVIKSTGGAAGVTAEQISTLADALERKTGVEAESIQRGQNLLLTFTNIRNAAGEGNDIFNQTTKIMTDLGVAMGTDASSAAIQLGKALNDPTQGITALTRVGVSFTDAQKAQIKALQESGNIMGAQKIILAELSKEFGGSAEAVGKTFAGAMDRARNALGSISEAMLTPAVPIFTKALEKVADAAYAVSDAIASGNLPQLINEAFGPGPKSIVVGIAGALSITLVGAMRTVGAQAMTMAATYGRSLATMVAANAPLVAAIAAISFAAHPFIKNWDSIAGLFSALWDRMRNAAADALNRLGNYSANVWQTISGHFLGAYRSFIASFIGPVSRAFNALFSALPASVRDALGGLSFSMPSFDSLPAGIQNAFQKVGEIAKSGLGYVSVLGKTAVDNFKTTWSGLPQFVRGVMGSFSTATEKAAKTSSGHIESFGNAAKKATEAAKKGHEAAEKAAKSHIRATSDLSEQSSLLMRGFIGLVEVMRRANQALEAAKWKKINDETQSYLKTQRDLDKIVTDVTKSIEDMDKQARYWGDTTDTTARKQTELKEAINRLIAEGVDPSSERVTGLRQKYDELAASQQTAAEKTFGLKDAMGEVGTVVSGFSGVLSGLGVNEGPVAGFIDGMEKALGVISNTDRIVTGTEKLTEMAKGFDLASAGAGLAKLGWAGFAIGVVAAVGVMGDSIVKFFGGWGKMINVLKLAWQGFGYVFAKIGELVIGGTISAIAFAWTGLVNGIKAGVNAIIFGINAAISGMRALGSSIEYVNYLTMDEFKPIQVDFTSALGAAMGGTLQDIIKGAAEAYDSQNLEKKMEEAAEAIRGNTKAIEETPAKVTEPKFNEAYRGMIEGANALVQKGIDTGDVALVQRGKREFEYYNNLAYSRDAGSPITINVSTGWTRDDAQKVGSLIVSELKASGVR